MQKRCQVTILLARRRRGDKLETCNQQENAKRVSAKGHENGRDRHKDGTSRDGLQRRNRRINTRESLLRRVEVMWELLGRGH